MASEIDDHIWDGYFTARDDDRVDEGSDPENSDSDYDDTGSQQGPDSDDEDEIELGPTLYVQNTWALKSRFQETSSVAAVNYVLDAMASVNLNIPLFLDAVSWGDVDCVQDAKIRYARSSLMHSEELSGIIHRWWKPPRTSTSRKSRPKGAKSIMQSFAATCIQSALNHELEKIAPNFSSSKGDDVHEDTLTSVALGQMINETKIMAPNLWALLHDLAYTPQQQKRNTMKNPDKVSL